MNDDTQTINKGILHVLRKGCKWMDGWMELLKKHGSKSTVNERQSE